MYVTELYCKGFRNLEELTLTPCGGINIIHGENAQGKTNLLEALWLLSGLKSFRGAKDSEMIGFNKEYAVIDAKFNNEKRENEIKLTVQKRRTATLNGVSLPMVSSLLGKYSAVVFAPSFLSVVQDGPQARRRFIDAAICQLKPAYGQTLAEYARIIKQRNVLLKDVRVNSALLDMLEVIDDKASALGEIIIKDRKEYLRMLCPFTEEIYESLSSGREKIKTDYLCSYGEQNELKEVFKRYRKEDILNKTTLHGPHRDDILISVNGVAVRTFGSQGQQRSCALALKFGEASVIKEYTGEQPIALLDDVMSELDTLRQDYILNHIKDRQVFITCCEPSSVLRMMSGKTVNVKNGRLY